MLLGIEQTFLLNEGSTFNFAIKSLYERNSINSRYTPLENLSDIF